MRAEQRLQQPCIGGRGCQTLLATCLSMREYVLLRAHGQRCAYREEQADGVSLGAGMLPLAPYSCGALLQALKVRTRVYRLSNVAVTPQAGHSCSSNSCRCPEKVLQSGQAGVVWITSVSDSENCSWSEVLSTVSTAGQASRLPPYGVRWPADQNGQNVTIVHERRKAPILQLTWHV